MKKESETYDRKSGRFLLAKKPDFTELARDCVAFATSRGGVIDIGIEDDAAEPPAGQKFPAGITEKLRRRIAELTVNVPLHAEIITASNKGQIVRLTIERSPSMPSTVDGRYFLRMSDGRKPITGDEVMQLFTDRETFSWEVKSGNKVARGEADRELLRQFIDGIRASGRVKNSVKKDKSDDEILDHYLLAQDELLTNLGVFCIGKASDRVRLGTAPIVQVVKYDHKQEKIDKWRWDDHSLSPFQLIDEIGKTIPDFKEFFEMPNGMKRSSIPAYNEAVVRELLVNAFAHRPYTQGGDIFISLYPDRMTIANNGRLPVGVKPSNILHASVRRNQNLVRIFHDLELMEAEGSGVDMIYEVLLSQGKPLPVIAERHECVEVTISREISAIDNVKIMDAATAEHDLTRRERICLGILLQQGSTSILRFAEMLNLENPDDIQHWLGRLEELGMVRLTDKRVKFPGYALAENSARVFDGEKIKKMTPMDFFKQRVLFDIKTNPGSTSGNIHERVGADTSQRSIQRILAALLEEGEIRAEGVTRGRRFWPNNYDKKPEKT